MSLLLEGINDGKKPISTPRNYHNQQGNTGTSQNENDRFNLRFETQSYTNPTLRLDDESMDDLGGSVWFKSQ